jgi:hypothetical protein
MISKTITNLFSNIKLIIGVVSTIAGVSVAGYVAYDGILDKIESNSVATQNVLKEVELTEITILKRIVRDAEQQSYFRSDLEYDEYLLNFTKLYNLKIKHNMLPPNTMWQPVKKVLK